MLKAQREEEDCCYVNTNKHGTGWFRPAGCCIKTIPNQYIKEWVSGKVTTKKSFLRVAESAHGEPESQVTPPPRQDRGSLQWDGTQLLRKCHPELGQNRLDPIASDTHTGMRAKGSVFEFKNKKTKNPEIPGRSVPTPQIQTYYTIS